MIFSHTLFGCALCAVFSPETRVAVKVTADDHKIKTANITWVLTKEFTNQLEQIYDLDQNNYLDKTELKPIEKALIDYIKPKDYLTHISYDKVIHKTNSKPIKIKKHKVYIKNSLLHFNYIVDLNYDVIKDNVLYINVNDDENYFVLLLAKSAVEFKSTFKTQRVLNEQSVAFYIQSAPKLEEKKQENITKVKTKTTKKEETLLSKFTKKVKQYLLKIDQGDNFALFILLGVSFIYGIVHALGPGHGKSLAFSYFMANKSSYLKAFLISQASAFIHIIGALILVLVSVFILQSVLNNFVTDSVEILTKVSAMMIILLASYILFNKINKKGCSCSSCCSTPTPTWSTNKPKEVSSLKPNFMKKDLYFVLTAGLIPCPGTVVLFIYAFILKTYFAVLLAAIFISIGMGLVIFLSAFLGVTFHKMSQKSNKVTNILEYLSVIIMILLGVLLYFNAQYI